MKRILLSVPHMGLRLLGVGPGDEVFCSTVTFVAAANVVRYLGAEPVFLDCDRGSWNVDCGLLKRAHQERRPKAVIVVHLYGQCADMDPILEVCGRYGVPVLEDAAEALGATYRIHHRDTEGTEKMAGIGRGQLEVLDLRIRQRRAIAFRDREAFADLAGISLMPQAPHGLHTNWLSCFLIDEQKFGCTRDELLRRLEEANIESRPVWKPMHLQPLYAGCKCYGGEVAEDLFRRGICLPSSSSLTAEEQQYVVNEVRKAAGRFTTETRSTQR